MKNIKYLILFVLLIFAFISGCGKTVRYLSDPTTVIPASGAANVAINTIITVVFEEAIDPASVSFKLTSSAGSDVDGALQATADSATITFTPASNLSATTEYTAQVSARAAAGDLMEGSYSWSFTTGSSVNVVSPEVNTVFPASGATGVGVNTTVTATFSKAMDPLTIKTANFTLSSSSGNVSGTVTYDPASYKATFTPSSNLTDSTVFTAAVSQNVKDIYGNKMAADKTWSFTVNPAAYAPTFNYVSGSYNYDLSLTLTSSTSGASIYYTTDGSDPTASSSLYTGPFTVNASKTVKAIAIKSGKENSPIVAQSYDIYGWLQVGDITATDNLTVDALAVDSSNNLYAGGLYTEHIGKWNGSSWSGMNNGMKKSGSYDNARVYAIGFSKGGTLYAGGDFDQAGSAAVRGVATWDATSSSWKDIGLVGFIDSGIMYSIVPSSQESIYGAITSITGGLTYRFVAKSDITIVGGDTAVMNANVYALAYDSTHDVLYAGGAFTTIASVTRNYIAKWNNASSTWEALGNGMNGTVYALAYDSTNNILYAGGDFTEAGAVQANYIAKWDGTAWSALGTGMDKKSVLALAYDSTNNILYAAGSFEAAGGVTIEGVAKWDGTAWSKFGNLDSTVYALVVDNSSVLYAGGAFTPPPYVAKWGKK